MILEWFEAYSIEEGDEIVMSGETYRVILISDTPLGYRFTVVNDTQEMKHVDCEIQTKFRVLCN